MREAALTHVFAFTDRREEVADWYRGCDLFDFRDGKATRKDSYWKIVE